MSQPIAYGIDFGTTNSAVAAAYPDHVEILKIAADPFPELLKSVLYLDRNGQELAGQEAVRQFSYTATAQTHCADCPLARFTRSGIESRCRWAARGGGCGDSRVLFGVKQFLAQGHVAGTHSWGRTFTLGDLAAVVIRRLKLLADAQLNHAVDRVVLGHPVRFSGEETFADHKRGLGRLVDAARAAGFREVELIDEPVAAHMSIAHSRGIVVTLDFGGGTLDIAVMDGESNFVFAKRGVAIGGDEFDGLLFDAKLARRFGLDQPAVPTQIARAMRSLSDSCFMLGNPNKLNELLDLAPHTKGLSELITVIQGGHLVGLHQAIERAKIELSRGQQAEILLERRGIEIEVEVTLQEFELLIAPSLKKVRDEICLALEEAGIQPVEVNAVTMTGGSSQIPAFVSLVSDIFGADRIRGSAVFNTVVNGLAQHARASWGS